MKTTLSTRIFHISPYGFTQILNGSSHWMGNSIPHPTSTHFAYFFMYFSFFMERDPPKICRVDTHWMWN